MKILGCTAVNRALQRCVPRISAAAVKAVAHARKKKKRPLPQSHDLTLSTCLRTFASVNVNLQSKDQVPFTHSHHTDPLFLCPIPPSPASGPKYLRQYTHTHPPSDQEL